MEINLWELIKLMLRSMLQEIVETWLQELQSALGNLLETSFYIERMPGLNGGIITISTVSKAINVLYLTTVGLLALKLCWKGWKVYVLGRDGEAEISPTRLLTNAVYALGVAIAFPFLYDISVELITAICNRVLDVFPGVNTGRFISAITAILTGSYLGSSSMLFTILLLIFVIVCVLLGIQMVLRGAEMLIYRLGIPFAVIGLIDSDGGIWKSYIQLFFQQIATTMIQYACICLALRLAASLSIASILSAIVFLIAGFKMPKILRSVVSSGGGGGGGHQVMYMAMMAVKTFAGA